MPTLDSVHKPSTCKDNKACNVKSPLITKGKPGKYRVLATDDDKFTNSLGPIIAPASQVDGPVTDEISWEPVVSVSCIFRDPISHNNIAAKRRRRDLYTSQGSCDKMCHGAWRTRKTYSTP